MANLPEPYGAVAFNVNAVALAAVPSMLRELLTPQLKLDRDPAGTLRRKAQLNFTWYTF